MKKADISRIIVKSEFMFMVFYLTTFYDAWIFIILHFLLNIYFCYNSVMKINDSTVVQKRVVIVGGGFGGIRTAMDLRRQNSRERLHITLVNNKPYFEYYPALYRLVTGASPIEALVPLSDIFNDKSVDVVVDKIIEVNLDSKTVVGESGSIYSADYIVLAVGSETSYFDVPGLPELSFGFKSVSEALRLKKHLHDLFSPHEHPTPTECVSHFHVVIVGAGPSGVEIAGDLSAFMKKLTKNHSVDPSLVTIDIIQSGSRVLPALPENVSRRVEARLRKLGMNLFLNRTLVKEEVEQVYLKDMSMQAKTVIWTAGTKVNPLVKNISGLELNPRGRVVVDEYLQAKGQIEIFVIGDIADTKLSGLAQTALSDGSYVAKAISRLVRGKSLQRYNQKKVSYSIPVGDNWGALVLGRFAFYGKIPYFIRHFIDFLFFAEIVSIPKLFGMFIDGYKYRSIDSNCRECN